MKPKDLLYTSTPSQTEHAVYTLIYFIPGNPGLIAYYTKFLSVLSSLLSQTTQDANPTIYHIYARNHLGFSDHSSSSDDRFPYGLANQILSAHQTLLSLRIPSGPRQGQCYDDVILIGHSMGSYMALELLSRFSKPFSSSSSSSPSFHSSVQDQAIEEVYEAPRTKAVILLFPTITFLAKSPGGLRWGYLLRLPYLPMVVSYLVRALCFTVSIKALTWLVKSCGNVPQDAAQITAAYLKSKTGVWETLHLAKDEMAMIKEDRWGNEVWGMDHETQEAKGTETKLVLYFGHSDSWVSDRTRDALIATRGQMRRDRPKSSPLMLIEEDQSVPHSFCFRHNDLVAEKVKRWISDISRPS